MVFAAGFATAIYMLAPATEVQETVSYEDSGAYEDGESYEDSGVDADTDFDSKQVMRIVKAGADKFMDFVKVASQRTLRLVKQKMAERKEVAKQPPD